MATSTAAAPRQKEFWFDDGSALLRLNDTIHAKIHKSFISSLSPDFFTRCAEPVRVSGPGLSSELQIDDAGTDIENIEVYKIKDESKISKEYLDTLLAHIYHTIPLLPTGTQAGSSHAHFEHALRLFTVTSPSKLDFGTIHNVVAAEVLLPILRAQPLKVNFEDYEILEDAFEVCTSARTSIDRNQIGEKEQSEITKLLRRALIYAYSVHPDIVFDPVEEPSTTTSAPPTPTPLPTSSTSTPPLPRLHPSTPQTYTHLLTSLASHFSSTLFQPPAARHMECTDVYAALWMERAVQPAFVGEGTASPFRTLGRLRGMGWGVGDVEGSGGGGSVREGEKEGGEGGGPCEECLEALREEWEEEALKIWNMIDQWIEESK